MRSRKRTMLAVFLVALMLPSSLNAQSGNLSTSADDLREKIRQMEAMDIGSMAPSTLEIYKRTLLRLYERSLVPYQQQINALAKIQELAEAGDTTAAVARDKLEKERAQVIDKISILRINLGLDGDHSPTAAGAGAEAAETSQPSAPTGHATPGSSPMVSAAVSTAAPTPAASPVTTCDTKGFPPILTDDVNRLARSILINEGSLKEKAEEISGQNYKLVFYTIADALKVQVNVPLATDSAGNPQSKTISIGELEPYRYLGETARTDKQLGATASAASVSAIDKPGFATLLGFGLENGLVEKNVRDTVLTLSTSPAALFMLGKTDNAQAYQDAGMLNRVGLAASFNISKQDSPLANATRSQLREYSIKYRFAGDRSPRSKKLEAVWDGVAKDIQARLVALNNAAEFISTDPILGPLAERVNIELQAGAVSLMASDGFKRNLNADGTFTDKAVCQLSDLILTYLADKVAPQKDKLGADAVSRFKTILVPNLVAAQLNLKIVREAFNKRLDEFFKGPEGTLAYINHREPSLGNYSEFKLLFERNTPVLRPLPLKTITANAGFSFYHQPNPLMKQQRLRAVNAALSFEGNASSPFTETADLGRLTYSLVGSFQRMFENGRIKGRKADLASLQFQVGIPLFKGLAFPFSLTYSNATETDRRRGWRANFGLKMDTDKLLELVRATSAR